MTRAIIEGSLLVIAEEKSGTSIVVPSMPGRPRFASVKARRDGVVLVDANENEHFLDEVRPSDIETANEVGVVVVKEMALDAGNEEIEYPIAVDVDLSIDHDESGSVPAP